MASLPRFWLQGGWPAATLAPLGAAVAALARRRRELYRAGRRPSERLSVPVIVVGNIFIGGTGKTPLVAWLAEELRGRGRRPGILLRGYGGRSRHWPRDVGPDSDPGEVGDEAVLLARRSGLPVVAGPDRPAAGRRLLELGCDVLVSDDGLQHYRLQRDLEIAVVDGQRGLGNGRCFPAGPLREPPDRLQEVDLVIANGASELTPYAFRLQPEPLRPLRAGDRPAPAGRVHGVAGIGNPGRFFEALRGLGLEVIPHAFPDHHPYLPEDLGFGDGLPVVMTEKDAVKVLPWADTRMWCLPVRAVPEPAAGEALNRLVDLCLEGTVRV